MTFRHIITWRLRTAEAGTDVARQIERRLRTLPAIVPEIQRLEVHHNVAYPERNWDLVAVIDFADQAGFEAFRVNADHRRVADFIAPHVAERAPIDVVVEE